MRPTSWWKALARHVPQTIRVRLSVLYAALFLAAGAALLGLTVGLVAHSLPSVAGSNLGKAQQAKLNDTCKRAQQSNAAVTPVGKRPPTEQPPSCGAVFAAGADAAAAAQRDQTINDLLVGSLIGLVVMAIASGGVGWLMAGRVLRPVRTITEAARRASEHHLGERLSLRGPDDELKELADTFDEMLDRLDAAFVSQRRFVADASHELRTPLTVMRTSIDVTLAKPKPSDEQLRSMAEKIRRSVDQAETLVESLLTLAVSGRRVTSRDLVDLAVMAEDALDAGQQGIAHSGIHVRSSLEAAPVRGDRLLLERMVANLVGNAVRHNVPDGWIEVHTGIRDGRASLTVANSGPVISEEQVGQLFEPFRRIEERTNDRDGVGLGLAIVASVGEAHGANVEARSQPLGGLIITVDLPSSVAPSTEAM